MDLQDPATCAALAPILSPAAALRLERGQGLAPADLLAAQRALHALSPADKRALARRMEDMASPEASVIVSAAAFIEPADFVTLVTLVVPAASEHPAMVPASITTDQLAAERLARARAHNQLIIQAANHTYTKLPTPPKHPGRSHPASTLHDRPFHTRQELLDGSAAQLQRKPKSTWSRGLSLLRAVGLRRPKASATPRHSAVCSSADDDSNYQDEDADLSGLAVDKPSTQKPPPSSVVVGFGGVSAMRAGVATTATRASATRATTESFSRPQTSTQQPSQQQPSVCLSPQARAQSFSRPAPQQPPSGSGSSQPSSTAPTYTQPAPTYDEGMRRPESARDDVPRALGTPPRER